MTLVSIITPSYNQAAFLEKTIQSVLAQTGAQIEYIIIDGGSRDGSVNIIQRYAGRLAYWVSEPDSGQAEAINKGLQRARGEIVAWLNSDDLYLPGAVSSAVAVLEQKPELGMVFGDAITIDAAGRPLNRLVFGNWGFRSSCAFASSASPPYLCAGLSWKRPVTWIPITIFYSIIISGCVSPAWRPFNTFQPTGPLPATIPRQKMWLKRQDLEKKP